MNKKLEEEIPRGNKRDLFSKKRDGWWHRILNVDHHSSETRIFNYSYGFTTDGIKGSMHFEDTREEDYGDDSDEDSTTEICMSDDCGNGE